MYNFKIKKGKSIVILVIFYCLISCSTIIYSSQGTVIDNRFTKFDNEDIVKDNRLNAIWISSSFVARYGKETTLSDTNNWINKLNQQKYFGCSDWRLPSINELKSIGNPDKSSKFIHGDSGLFDENGGKEYWSKYKVKTGKLIITIYPDNPKNSHSSVTYSPSWEFSTRDVTSDGIEIVTKSVSCNRVLYRPGCFKEVVGKDEETADTRPICNTSKTFDKPF